MSTELAASISNAVKTAMRAKDSARLTTLRFLQAAIKQKEVDERRTLDDAEILAIIEKQVKQRRESIAAFQQAGRTESAQQEQAELDILQTFLPAQASQAEIDAAIQTAMDQVVAQGVSGPAAMGKVMALVKAALAGKADMSAVSARVKAKLSA